MAGMTTRLVVASERGPYPVLVGRGLLGQLGPLGAAEGLARPRVVVSDTTVGPLHARAAAAALGAGPPLELSDGEAFKRWQQVEAVLGRWLELGVHRGDVVAAIGGGVVTDLVGFAAAVYLRGIDWVAAPTTLLAMVDTAVGGKTGVNVPRGKNLVGAFQAAPAGGRPTSRPWTAGARFRPARPRSSSTAGSPTAGLLELASRRPGGRTRPRPTVVRAGRRAARSRPRSSPPTSASRAGARR